MGIAKVFQFLRTWLFHDRVRIMSADGRLGDLRPGVEFVVDEIVFRVLKKEVYAISENSAKVRLQLKLIDKVDSSWDENAKLPTRARFADSDWEMNILAQRKERISVHAKLLEVIHFQGVRSERLVMDVRNEDIAILSNDFERFVE